MSRVLEAEKLWLFRDDLVLVVDGARHGRWVEPLHLVSMWVQLHNVPSLNMTEKMAYVIGGLIGKVLKVDKDDGHDCIGRFLCIKVCFDVCEHLCIDFGYEGLLNYCIICGKIRHMTRCCKSEILGEEVSEEIECQRMGREKAFDAGLIGVGGSIVLEAGRVILVNHLEMETGITKTTETRMGGCFRTLTLFNLFPIIEAISRGGVKQSREDDYELDVIDKAVYRMYKIQRSGVDQVEATYEGSPHLQ
ncbi:hypothetical protein D8674_026043 [Pyrus ussuriensis x Pyrus communis]|uniref:DUF4283 domain-containing protein n=1 Tax=Pyrus ussuriensis x Pyrus communis TaxID=2448454 RepID=A0A5N5I702_9ROSA|nr:hypothetical protein D8674_026043 [Pyrus ussuriensis x Pyrus communis]